MFLRNILVGLFTIFSFNFCMAQPCKCEARYISSKDSLRQAIKTDPRMRLIALQKIIPGVAIDLRYAGTNNFTKTILYHHPIACLHVEPAEALRKAQAELNNQGLGLKIYDAYRPLSVSCKLWRLVPDRHYAANPRKGSNHNRAVAVDLTLIDLKTCKELDMGTSFDNFTDTAHHDFMQLPQQVLANRRLLKSIMRKYGFGMVPEEWWHYQWRNRRDYEVMDLDFDDLKEFL
jgi:D-alanyl-D-alanine dipeptidase